ncbi:MAG: hypothetical protein JWP12_2793 [Bacteroidetes bacterium]|nr:hypothetical protein [Bacteroidota bacterium]
MNTAIMLSLLLVSGIVLMISEGDKLFSKKSKRYSGVQIPAECENSGVENNLFPDDKSNGVNLLDFSGGTLGI